VTKICSDFVGGSVQVGYNLDRPEQSVQVDSHVAQVQGEADIWRRFGGGSDRNRALLGNPVQPAHDMQIVQNRINTGYFASC
jgi:ABC-type taurine transport system substrate-binding protein